MPVDSHQETIKYLKEKVIDGYMLGDLHRLIGLPIRPNQFGNCNFPIVLYLFSCIEFLGGLVSEIRIPESGYNSTNDRVWAYMKLTFGENLQEFEKHKDSFVQIFRNGLTHQFFAKNAGVNRKGESLFGTSEGGKIVLDADKFYLIFRDSCETLKSLIDSSPELAERISVRYKEIQERNRKKWPSLSPSIIVSNATLPREFPPDQALATPSLPPDEEVTD